jgi:hypothetical protein
MLRRSFAAIALTATLAHANLQLDFPADRLGQGDFNTVEQVSADAWLVIDGVDQARLPANTIIQGGNPLAVGLIWAYDADTVWNLEERLAAGAEVALRDLRLTLACPGGAPSHSWSRGEQVAYNYQVGVPFPVNLPPSMPVFATLECGTRVTPAPRPGSLLLLEAAPNPFNSSTSLAFTLERPTHVRLEVFNLSGRSVRVLGDGNLGPGEHEVPLDAQGLPTGVYLARLTTRDGVATRKVLFLK